MTSYLNKIEAFIEQLDQETLAALENITTIREFKKGDYLLRGDKVCRYSYLIEKGIARKFYLNDGKEITTDLLFSNDIAVSFDSYCLQKPGREFIQALTNIITSQTYFAAFQTIKQQFPKLAALDLMMTEHYAMWLENRLFEFHTMDATKRYINLIETHPEIVKYIPLTHIASYLGISLETLSRIRAKI